MKNTLFRKAIIGGFNKEDVMEYVEKLESEIERLKKVEKSAMALEKSVTEHLQKETEKSESDILKESNVTDQMTGSLVNEIESIRMFTSGLVDGLIVASSTTEYKELETILPKNSKIPIVFLERSVNDCPFDSVMISDYDAVRQSVEYLISKGHKKIGFIYGITTISPAIERLRAYKDALEKNGIEFNKKYIKDVPNHSFEAVDSLVKNGCSAIIAATNKVTIDTILYFLNNDISIKNQIQLTGFLNDDYSSINLTNMLLILHPIKELANHSVRLLFNRMENPDSSIKNTILLSRFAKPQN